MVAQLALGTVQFGLAYGVQGGTARVPDEEVRAILALAEANGITRLDTAPAYGAIEERLAELAGDRRFAIVSKIAALPPGSAEERRAAARASVARSRERLGERLAGLLFHDAGDVLGDDGEALWACVREAAGPSLPLGVSCYDIDTLNRCHRRYSVDMAQLPGGALDQRLARADTGAIEITLRSLFLQGLLLMPLADAAARVPAARGPLSAWHAFCSQNGLSPLVAALGVAKGLPGIDYCVVGVDSSRQLEEICHAWHEAVPLDAPSLSCEDPAVIDPRRWSAAR